MLLSSPNVSTVDGGVHGHRAFVFLSPYIVDRGALPRLTLNDAIYVRCMCRLSAYVCVHKNLRAHVRTAQIFFWAFSQKLLTGELSTAHGYPRASPTKRDNTPFKKTARSEAVVAEVPAGRSGRECRHTPLRGGRPFQGLSPHPYIFVSFKSTMYFM